MAQTVTIGEQKVSPESESLKFSATPTPQVENPSDSTALVVIPDGIVLIMSAGHSNSKPTSGDNIAGYLLSNTHRRRVQVVTWFCGDSVTAKTQRSHRKKITAWNSSSVLISWNVVFRWHLSPSGNTHWLITIPDRKYTLVNHNTRPEVHIG